MRKIGSISKFLGLLTWFVMVATLAYAQVPTAPVGLERTDTAPVIGNQYFPVFAAKSLPDADPLLVPVASNRPLDQDHGTVTRAILYIHDLTRNPHEGITMLATLAGSDNETSLILAPQFPSIADIQRFRKFLPDYGEGMAVWMPTQWWHGAESITKAPQKGVSSFTVADMLLLYLGDRSKFPSLREVVIAGHGMGADFVLRYAAMGRAAAVLDQDAIEVRYVAANAASYPYFTRERPVGDKTSLQVPDTTKCPTYQNYPYGLDNLNSYGRSVGMQDIRLAIPPARFCIYWAGVPILIFISIRIARRNYRALIVIAEDGIIKIT